MVKSMAFKQVGFMLGKFGATPQDRTRVAVNPQGELFAGKRDDPSAKHFH